MSSSSSLYNQLSFLSKNSGEFLEEDVKIDEDIGFEPLPGEVIFPGEVPSEEEWTFAPLFNKDQLGKPHVWQIGWDPKNEELVWIHGHLGGSIQTERKRVTTNQSGRDIQEQALLQANQEVNVKQRSGYTFGEVTESTEIPLQLAKIYYPPGSKDPLTGKKETTQIKPDDFPVWVQVKIDGVRGGIKLDSNNKVIIYSREKIEYPWLQHIKNEVQHLFKYLPPGTGLDAEIYTPDLKGEQLKSAVRTTKEMSPDNPKLKAFIFDIIIPNVVLEQRYNMLVRAYQQYLKDYGKNTQFFIITHTPAMSYKDIEDIHNEAVELGYEGIVIRWPSLKTNSKKITNSKTMTSPKKRAEYTLYKGKRNNALLKYKAFEDSEGIIIAVFDGEGREQGLAIFRIRDERGNEFNCRPRGSHELRAYWFLHPELCIGKLYTFRHFGYTGYGIPLMPTGVGFRERK